MSSMRPQGNSVTPQVKKGVDWPQLTWPPMDKNVLRGMSQAERATLDGWYLAVQNVVNAQFTAVGSKVVSLDSRISEIENKKS